MSERYQEENERYQEDPIAPEHLKRLTIERMPFQEVFFLNLEYSDGDQYVVSDVWTDRDVDRFFVPATRELEVGDDKYPVSRVEERLKFPIMRVVMFQGDGSFTDGLIADFRRIKEGAISVEDTESMEIPYKKIIQIDAFISFDELGDDESDMLDEDRKVVFSGGQEFHEILRHLRDRVDEMREEQYKNSRLELEALEKNKQKSKKQAESAAKFGAKVIKDIDKPTGDQ